MAEETNLLTWAGGWGLPSLDDSCLQALAYSKFAGFPTKVTCCNNPYKSPTGTLPALRLPDDIFCGCDDIIDYLKTNNYNTDKELSDKQKIDTLGLCCYVDDMLRPALLYMTWLVDQNYTQFTRGWYAKQLKFPYNYLIPAKYFNHAKKFVAHKLNIEESDVICEVIEMKLTEKAGVEPVHLLDSIVPLNRRAEACFKVLNDILGDQEFLFGDSPTTLDSKVFSSLLIMLKIPLPTNRLKFRILEYPKLEQYCDQILRLYFPTVARELGPPNQFKDEVEESRTNKINAVLSVGFAVVAMVFYALSSGIVQFEVEERESCENCQGKTTGKTEET